ncbi:MAG: alpha/beta hydrolase [Candidatus Eremiobacteraeota bacterium]|nr:alpha/beta hydrolase [Candidatus Eremiobacteraeota bacterium]
MSHLRRSEPYLAAERDLEAALEWAKKSYPSLAIIVWGSSYSASLVFVLAANHQGEVTKLLAFSPGEYFGDELHVADSAKRVTASIFVDSAADEKEIAEAKRLLDASPATVRVQYRPRHGVHGSSTLRKDRNPEGYEDNWTAVESFLRR